MDNHRPLSRILEMYANMNTEPPCVRWCASVLLECAHAARQLLNCLNACQDIKCTPPGSSISTALAIYRLTEAHRQSVSGLQEFSNC